MDTPILQYNPLGGIPVSSGFALRQGPIFYWPQIENLVGGATETDLDAQPVGHLPANCLIIVVTEDQATMWIRVFDDTSPSTDLVTGVIRPTDYDAITSPYVLHRVYAPIIVEPQPPLLSGRQGIKSLVSGQEFIDVTFDTPMPSADWKFRSSRVVNTVDPDPMLMWPATVTQKTINGFRVQLNGQPDTANYHLEWSIETPTVAVPEILTDTYEGSLTAIPSGQAYVDVVFGSEKATSEWEFLVGPYVENLVDDNTHPIIFVTMIIQRTTTGFRALLNAATDTVNYNLRWRINQE
jgi:hypothetical protein